jgi:uncharacterized protein (DUF58 family)
VTLALRAALPPAQRGVRNLELLIRRRVDGMLHGEYRGMLPGPGWESAEGRPYQLGDDVRRIDWSLTARTNEVQVRDTVADHELETWVVIDGSASLDFGTDQWEKRDLAVAVAATFGFMSSMAGSRFGAVVADPSGVVVHPALSGVDHVRRILRDLERRPRPGVGDTDLPGAIERIRRIGRRPGAVVLVSDLLGDDGWVGPMRAHAHRCRTIVTEVRDVREDELPAVGYLTLVDPETGRTRDVQTNDARLRQRFATAAAERRASIHRSARSSGSDHLVLRTDGDWLNDIVRFHLIKRSTR